MNTPGHWSSGPNEFLRNMGTCVILFGCPHMNQDYDKIKRHLINGGCMTVSSTDIFELCILTRLENAFYRFFKSLHVVHILPSPIAFGQANF